MNMFKKCIVLFILDNTGGSWRRRNPDSERFCRELLAWWSAAKTQSVIPVCGLE